MDKTNKFSLSLEKEIIKEKKIDQFSSEFFLNRLPVTLATTIGNSLRRLVLEFISGWAVFAIKISNGKEIVDELRALDGVVELPIHLINKIRQLVVSSEKEKDSKEIQVLEIDIDNSQKKTAYEVTGKDVKGKLKIINPELYLFTISPNSKLKISLYYRYYWGTSLAEENKKLLSDEKEIIFLDRADYCPVKAVGLGEVKELVISLDKKEEQISLTITTDGSISPKNSLIETLKIWQNIGISLLEKIS